MTSATTQNTDHFRGEDFATLLDETLGCDSSFEGSVIHGRVIRLTDTHVIVDVGLKSEGRVALREFASLDSDPKVKIGDVVELYVERYE
ncbi:MAG: S1 RNA-binding domain-containing protein, partial [Acetobacter sp.]|nr:S1 RNA-binding domain-containing protein [Acetobacter sp.]